MKIGKSFDDPHHHQYQIGHLRTQKDGYVFQKIGKKRQDWVQEHRLVMEKKIGRKLFQMEAVHHKMALEMTTG